MPRDVDPHLTVLPDCPTGQPGKPASELEIFTIELKSAARVTDAWIYVIVLAAVAAIAGALWFWG